MICNPGADSFFRVGLYCIVSIFIPMQSRIISDNWPLIQMNAVLIKFYPIVHRAINGCRWVSHDMTGSVTLSDQSGKDWTQ